MKKYITLTIESENNEGVLTSKEYKLRLTIQHAVELEDKLGCNPLLCFKDFIDGLSQGAIDGDIDVYKLASTKQKHISLIIYYAMKKYQPDITYTQTCDLIDDYIDMGNTVYDLISIAFDILDKAGMVPMGEEEGASQAKN